MSARLEGESFEYPRGYGPGDPMSGYLSAEEIEAAKQAEIDWFNRQLLELTRDANALKAYGRELGR